MKNTKRGFTIVELVIVIAIIAILAAILIPVFSNVTSNAEKAANQAEIKNVYSAFVADKAVAGEFDYAASADGYVYSEDNGATFYKADGTKFGTSAGAVVKNNDTGWDIYAKA